MARNKDFSITNFDGGLNNSDPPSSIPQDQVVEANNVEFFYSTLGERRMGCTDIDLPSAITGDAQILVISWLKRHLPTTSEAESELFVLGQHTTNQHYSLQRKDLSWHTITPVTDIDVTDNHGYELSGITLHGKLFIAYKSVGGVDRLHVWDGTSLRPTGLSEPAPPTAANQGVGTITGTRYYRVRYLVTSGSTSLLQSEPSETLTFIPSGTGLSIRITKPVTINEGETGWSIEASVDNANFYIIAALPVATTTYDDTTPYSPGYGAYELAEDIGDYSLIPSGKFLAADEDRLMIAGSNEDEALASRVMWTPVFADPGTGNDERLALDTDPFIDLDNYEGGPITFLSNPVNGYIYAFKRSHTYRLSRTGQRNRAYTATNLSKSLGALPGSVVEGVDQYGMPCLYFLDPETGPCRTGGTRLIQSCGKDILSTWLDVNLDAIIVSRAVFYPHKQQVHWWISTGINTTPNLKIVLHCTNTREQNDGIRRGWVTADGTIATAYTTCLYAENIDMNVDRSLVLKPFIGVTAANGYVLLCDNAAFDHGDTYHANIKSKPFVIAGLLNKFGVMAGSLLAESSETASILVNVSKDFDLETFSKTVDFQASDGATLEPHVVKQMRNLNFSQMYAMQVEFEDVDTPNGVWKLNQFDMKLRMEDTA